jgi:hypothetical protein
MIEIYCIQKYPNKKIDNKKLVEIRNKLSDNNVQFLNKCGIPEQYGIFFAMGGSLILEGVLSACYHVCPMEETLQFDTTFLYILMVLCFFKFYQFRHPDITANAHGIFLFVGISLALEAFSYYFPLEIYLYVFVGSSLCVILSVVFILLYKRPFSYGGLIFFSITTIGNLLLLAFIGYNTYVHTNAHSNDAVSNYLLLIYGANATAYGAYYVVMKYYYLVKLPKSTESLTFTCWIHGILSAFTFGMALFFFAGFKEKDTSLSSSESRHLNAECTIWIFDKHDIWHFFSSFGFLFLFMFLLTIEDNNINTPWNEIPVF